MAYKLTQGWVSCKRLLTNRGADGYYWFVRLDGSLLRYGRRVGKRTEKHGSVAERRQEGASHGCQDSVCKGPASAGFLFLAEATTDKVVRPSTVA